MWACATLAPARVRVETWGCGRESVAIGSPDELTPLRGRVGPPLAHRPAIAIEVQKMGTLLKLFSAEGAPEPRVGTVVTLPSFCCLRLRLCLELYFSSLPRL